jgi:hypothetical protein
MPPDHPGEVLERIVLPLLLQCQLRETQGRIVGEVTARVAIDEALEGFDATGSICAEKGESLGKLPLLLRAGRPRDAPVRSPAAEED